jgi:hypothetical protein
VPGAESGHQGKDGKRTHADAHIHTRITHTHETHRHAKADTHTPRGDKRLPILELRAVDDVLLRDAVCVCI